MTDEIAYRELKAGEVIQPGDEWQTASGRWAMFHQSSIGRTIGAMQARRPYSITQITRERDAALVELAQLQQSQPVADHIADVSKMVESELEQKAWELFVHATQGIEHSFTMAHYWMKERNRRRQAGMTTTDVVGDRS